MTDSRGVPRQKKPVVVTVDSNTSERRTPRFMNLVVRAYREWDSDEDRDEDSVRYRKAS